MEAHRRVGVDDDGAAQVRARGVLCRRLATPRGQPQQLDAAIAEPRDDLVRAVARRIRDHEDLATLNGIVELEELLQGAGNYFGPIIDRNRDADQWPFPGRRDSPGRAPQRSQELERSEERRVGKECRSRW